MVKRCAGVVVVVLLAVPAWAQAPAAEDAMAHPWSLGASVGMGGVSLNLLLNSSTGLGSLGTTSSPSPTAAVSFERRLAEPSSLLFGFNTSVASISSGSSGFGSFSSTANAVGALAGLRFVLGGRDGLVTVSGSLAFSLSYLSVENNFGASGRTSGLGLELHGGLAVERVLARQLSLRLAAELLNFGYTFGTLSFSSAPFSGFSFSVPVAPSIELRMYF